MVSKKKIGICLITIVILNVLIISVVLGAYEESERYVWGFFAVANTVDFLCLAIGIYMLSVHFKQTKPKLSKFLFGLGIYVIVCTVCAIAYFICKIYGVINI